MATQKKAVDPKKSEKLAKFRADRLAAKQKEAQEKAQQTPAEEQPSNEQGSNIQDVVDLNEHPELDTQNSNTDSQTGDTDSANDTDDSVEDTRDAESIENEVIMEADDIEEQVRQIGLPKVFLSEELPSTRFNPLGKNVVKRGYESGMIDEGVGGGDGIPMDFESPSFSSSSSTDNQIPDKTPSSSSGSSSDGMKSDGLGNAGASKPAFDWEQPKGDGKSNLGNSSSMSSSQPNDDKEKRKNARKTAEVLLTSYQNLFPIPFRSIAQVSEKKVIKMQRNNEINVEMKVLADGTTVADAINTHNLACEQVLIVTDDMKEDLREPLQDYLMEAGAELTPAQRLMVAIVPHVIEMTKNCIALKTTMNESLAAFKDFHQQHLMAGARPINQAPPQRPRPVAQEEKAPVEQKTPASKPTEEKKQEEIPVLDLEEYLDTVS